MPGSDASTSKNRLTEWLADHPRFVGALFTMVVLLSKAGAVAANGGTATNGP